MFLIVSLSGRPVYDPNPLRPNPNPKKPVLGSCRVRGLGQTLTPLSLSLVDSLLLIVNLPIKEGPGILRMIRSILH